MRPRLWLSLVPRVLGAARAAIDRIARGSLDFIVRVWDKAGQDDIFFLAGGIAFNVLVAAVPFLLLLVSIFGFVLQAAVDDPQQVAVEYVFTILPPSPEVEVWTRTFVEEAVGGAARFGLLGLILFIWFSTRLIGSLRAALRAIFDLREDRGIVAGKIFDAQMVIVAGTLLLVNTGITVVLEAVQTHGVELLGIHGGGLEALQSAWAQLLALAFIFLMFVLIYRYLPARRTPWRISLVAATFTAAGWEILKGAFAWYVANFAQHATMYGALATLVLLVFWIYYSSVVFILGGEVGQVYDLYRIRRRQRELLD
jgi:membrane protein